MSAHARIEVVAGNAAGTWLDVTDELLIGRHADGLGRLADDEEISRYHARVSLDTGGLCAIEDLGSTNGTFVNGLRLSVPKALKEGDTIELGSSTLVVRDLPSPAAAEPSGHAPAKADDQDTAERPAPAAAVPAPESPPQPKLPEPAPEPKLPEPPPEPKLPEPAPEPKLPEPAPEPEPTPPAAIPQLSLRLEIDFAANEALIALGDDAEPMRIVLESGAWRLAPPTDG
jgi:predicted component of type VI protein secretion system